MFSHWTPALSVGVEEIDNQHKEFIRMLGELLDAMSKAQSRQKVGEVIKFMEEYAEQHFALEEKYMLDNFYSGYEEHKQQHDIFRANVNNVKNRLSEKEELLVLAIDVERSLYKWLLTHIGKIDKKLGKFLSEKAKK